MAAIIKCIFFIVYQNINQLRIIVHCWERVPLAEVTVNVFVFEDQSLYPSNAGEMLAPEESPQVRKILDRSVPVFTEMVTVPFSVSIIGFSEMIFPLFLS